MMSFLSSVIAFIRVIPALKGWFDWFVAEYTRREIEAMKQEVRDGIRQAVEEYDQRALERALGSPLAGKPSHRPGTTVVDADSLPGIVRDEEGTRGRGVP